MPSLKEQAKKSKLNIEETRSVSGVVNSKKPQRKPTSIRLTDVEKEMLRNIVSNLDNYLTKSVSDGDVIRALIHIGSMLDIQKILKAYKQSL